MSLARRRTHQRPDCQICSGNSRWIYRLESKMLIEGKKISLSRLSVAGDSITIEAAQHPTYKPCGMATMLIFRIDGKNAEEHVAIAHMSLTQLVVVLANASHPSDCIVANSALESDSASPDLSPHRHMCLRRREPHSDTLQIRGRHMNLSPEKSVANPHLEECDRITLPLGLAWEEMLDVWGIAECACAHSRCQGKAASAKNHRLSACHRFYDTQSPPSCPSIKQPLQSKNTTLDRKLTPPAHRTLSCLRNLMIIAGTGRIDVRSTKFETGG